ncbi:GTP cyclohydrolase-2 [Kordia sp. SMS9]|uniref:GTP cyclohydrolase II RibA n=1 Tax=Kordia sp. SMS9 TaxID=2282170 RepID=UPI000E0D6316|nr:GTP cyclohydrolase II RibA [Kordia sp. SMS9]AXG70218.1 GTP cyclohydrolase-2 [Kordia sp. SMS9]
MEQKIDKQIRNRVVIPIETVTQKIDGAFFTFHKEYLETDKEHIVIGLGEWGKKLPIVRMHSECLTGDVFGSERCDCGNQLQESLDLIHEKGGFLIYLRQEGRGIGLYNKIDAYELQLKGIDTFEANKTLGFDHDLRDFSVAAKMLKALGVTEIILHSNNLDKKGQLEKNGVKVVEMINTKSYIKEGNQNYLQAKKYIAGHQINLEPKG